MSWLINAAQLDKLRKDQKNVVILDATAYLEAGRQPKEEFLQNHIAGARFLDLEVFNDKGTSLPKMLIRDEAYISEHVGALGITKEQKIILYDNSPCYTSCRALWMFKVFGHASSQLYILNGGLDAWEKYGGKMESGEARPINPKSYQVDFGSHHIRTLVQMKTNLHHPSEQVIDVRNPVRFAGGPEQRAGLRAGHIPGSFCFPFTTMFESDGRWKAIDKIRKQLTGLGVDLASPIVTTCGSGTTAPILNFALDLMDCSNHSLYDGSWTEWGAEQLYQGEESLAERPVRTSLE